MSVWIIEPRDPLIVRDGRPFGPTPGARANTLSFPLPSTLVGALRTRAGSDTQGHFIEKPETVLQYSMRGPLLVELDESDEIEQYYLPAPADALLYTNSKQKVRRVWLSPQEELKNSISNQPDNLCYISPKEIIKGKAYSDAPSFWNAADFMQWLSQPEDSPSDSDNDFAFANPGIKSLPKDTRMHVSINKDTQTGEDGLLYLTSGLEFVRVEEQKDDAYRKSFHRLALAVDFDHPIKDDNRRLAPLGGERRLMHWRTGAGTFDEQLSAKRSEIIEQIYQEKQARVVLLTPAYFQHGYRPELQWSMGGVTATLKGVVNPRYQTAGGWDYKENQPKATKRIAPAGSVYYVAFAEDADNADIEAWCNAVWLRNISDGEQWQRDGFGLAVLGTWKKEQ
jgi:CRISPR-associated protein Cmr3